MAMFQRTLMYNVYIQYTSLTARSHYQAESFYRQPARRACSAGGIPSSGFHYKLTISISGRPQIYERIDDMWWKERFLFQAK